MRRCNLILLPKSEAKLTMSRDRINLFICFCALFLKICDSGLLEPSRRCGLSDGECQRDFFQYIGSNYAKKGIPALGIPILDPYILQNVTISFRDVINVNLVDGVAEGIGDCITTNYNTDIKTKTKISEFICDPIVIKGYYTLTTGPFLRLLTGNTLDSEGYIEATFDKWYMNVSYPFVVEKRENGEVYIRCLFHKAQYDQSFGCIKVSVSNLTQGDEFTSQTVVDYTNSNWVTLINSFGRYFGDKAIEFYYREQEKFFNNVPAKYYITDDLTSYIEEEKEDEEEKEEEDDDEDDDEEDDEE